ncbi:PfkB family carbohydrate kinase [Kribbella sp. NPDC051952]|uniref:PfkB family carbohydrate kinase n=1 Tax=Kribbella sp. NPDC051952 TaxID=3154851 RepID=UPI0034448AAF
MRDNNSPEDLQIILLHILEKLRSSGGATFSRLYSGRDGLTAPLLELATVKWYATVRDVAPESSALAVIGECVQELSTTDKVVVDAVLGLGLFVDEYAQSRISRRTIQGLSDRQLRQRRRTLIDNWHALHKALAGGAGDPPTGNVPTVGALRASIEPDALQAVARQLVSREVYSTRSTTSALPSFGGAARPLSERTRGRILVFGAAVMDAIFRISEPPRWEASSEAQEFVLSPGGKGLKQAVAAARLGHRVSLVAAVADDRFGTEIVNHLRANHVDTSLLKIVPGADTPVTGVLEMDLGDSLAAYWRNEKEVRLDPWDCDELVPELLDCDAVLITFEIPRETVEHTLALLHEAGRRPLTIVTAAQPYPDGTLAPRSLAQIDYLVAHPWELRRRAFSGAQSFDPDTVARDLLKSRVGSVCLLLRGGCTMYSRSAKDVIQTPVFASIYKESATARDAFCAALADELIQSGERFSAAAAAWASAAMSRAIADYQLNNSLPTPELIQEMLTRLQTRS